MKILSIGKTIQHHPLDITNISLSELHTITNIEAFSYIIIHGGDGLIRRVVKALHPIKHQVKFIIHPTGSFNVIAKQHHVPPLDEVLAMLQNGETPQYNKQPYYSLNHEVFLFSAGNMGDLQHIFLSETLRFGLLKRGVGKYLLAFLFLLPVHIVMTPFMFMSKRKFFIFTPFPSLPNFANFYSSLKEIEIDLDNTYNHIELDGDLVTIPEQILHIKSEGTLDIVS